MHTLKQHFGLLERLLGEIALKKKIESKPKILESLILKDLQEIRYFENLASLSYEEKKSIILSKPADGWLPENNQLDTISKIIFLLEGEDGEVQMLDGIRIGYVGIDSDYDITIYSYALKSKAPILYNLIDSSSPCIFWPVYEPVYILDPYLETEVNSGKYTLSYTYSRIEPRGTGNIAIESFPSMETYLEALIPKLESSSWRDLEYLEEEKKEVVWDIVVNIMAPIKLRSIPDQISRFLTKKEQTAFKIIRKQTKFLENSFEKLYSGLEAVLTPASGSLAILGIAGLIELPITEIFIYLAHLDEMKLMLLKNPDLATQYSNIIKLSGQDTPEKLKAALISTDISYLPGLQDYYSSSKSWTYSFYFIGAFVLTALVAYGLYCNIKMGQPLNSIVKK
jgi:hypothetical protein